jgi:hypothetical protein
MIEHVCLQYVVVGTLDENFTPNVLHEKYVMSNLWVTLREVEALDTCFL